MSLNDLYVFLLAEVTEVPILFCFKLPFYHGTAPISLAPGRERAECTQFSTRRRALPVNQYTATWTLTAEDGRLVISFHYTLKCILIAPRVFFYNCLLVSWLPSGLCHGVITFVVFFLKNNYVYLLSYKTRLQ
ncbi:hypothetical protein HPB48_022573 [Haemaphysalis longicornis]|uniref:Uncharacterized protein n=1 Tax=Haemaphysalis longicornis TaxID=44386 RepID=A0A9J6GTL7_HAELO|nr:hypothetical protein HPB48_022573 [Haemaphysalis longicornis]